MADKRKPVFVLLLRIPGTAVKHKLELFAGTQFLKGRRNYRRHNRGSTAYTDPRTGHWCNTHSRFRIRSNGRWIGGKGKGKNVRLFTWYEFRDILWHSMKSEIRDTIQEKVNESYRQDVEATISVD